jgi:hypothetical protein
MTLRNHRFVSVIRLVAGEVHHGHPWPDFPEKPLRTARRRT